MRGGGDPSLGYGGVGACKRCIWGERIGPIDPMWQVSVEKDAN